MIAPPGNDSPTIPELTLAWYAQPSQAVYSRVTVGLLERAYGGVIFKSTTGSDNITMENYAGSGTDEWWLQMYGVPTKGADRTGQTFHEQHRETPGQHGQTPTTLATEKT